MILKSPQNEVLIMAVLRTAGLDVQYEPTKKYFFNKPEGLR